MDVRAGMGAERLKAGTALLIGSDSCDRILEQLPFESQACADKGSKLSLLLRCPLWPARHLTALPESAEGRGRIGSMATPFMPPSHS